MQKKQERKEQRDAMLLAMEEKKRIRRNFYIIFIQRNFR